MAQAEKNLPVGTILSLWKLPSGWSANWISCDGQIINDGPYKGQKAPALNNGQRFLRGGPSNLAGTYQNQDTNMAKLGGTYLDRYFVEGAASDEGAGWGCNEAGATIEAWTNEDAFSRKHSNARCRVTRHIQFTGTNGETRPNNMAVLFYMKIK